MQVVFLDQQTFSPKISLDNIESEVSNLICYATTTQDQVIERCMSADIIITNKVILSKEILKQLPQLSNNDGATFRTADTRARARPRSRDTTKMVLSSCLCPSGPLCFLLCHPLCSLCVSLCLPPLGGACPQTTAACFTALPTRAMECSPTRRAAGLASLRLPSVGTATSSARSMLVLPLTMG